MKFKMNGVKAEEPTAYHIEYFYDRHAKAWVVQVYDNLDVEHHSEYCPNKEWRDITIADLKKEYSTENVIKK